MLAVRIVGDEEEGDGSPDFCSLCGRESDDYLVTPWDHINVCRDCVPEFACYGAAVNESLDHALQQSELMKIFKRLKAQRHATSS